MPIIPDYESQVAPTNAPALQVDQSAPIEAFGGGQAAAGLAAIGTTAGEFEKQFSEYKKQADNARVMAGFDQLTKAKNALIFDPTNGAMTKKGQDAATVVQDYGGQFNKAADDYQNQLTNDDQRAMFQRIRSKVGDELNQTLEKHTYTEVQSYNKEVIDSTIKTSVDDATLNFTDPGKIAASAQRVRDLAIKQANAAGIHDPELVEERVRQQTSKVYVGVLQRMADSPEAAGDAKGFFAGVQGQMTTEDREKIDNVLKVSGQAQESAQKADQIIKQHQDLPSALLAARELPPGELRQKVIANIKDFHADDRAAKEDFDRTRFDQASDIVENSGGRGRVPPTLLAGMASAQREKLEQRARDLRAGVTADKASPVYYNLMNTAGEKPDNFKRLNLNEYRGKITPEELEKMIGMQSDMKQGKTNLNLDQHRSASELISTTAAAVGVSRRYDAEKYKMFEDATHRAITLETERQGNKKLSEEDTRRIVDQQARGITTGWFGGIGKRAYENFVTDVKDIPQEQLDQIKQAMKRNNVPYSDRAAMDAYFMSAGEKPSGR